MTKRKREIYSNWIGSKYYEIIMKWKIDIVNILIMSALLHTDWIHAESKITVIISLVELRDVSRLGAWFLCIYCNSK